MAKMARFKTGYLQREIPIVATLAADLKVGQICTFSGVDGTALAALGDSAALAAGQYIIAQSDMTMGYGHIPVENRDYRYSEVVAASTTPKTVAVFRINDPGDIIAYTA